MPACREPYPEEPFSFKRPEAADEDPAIKKERLRKEKQEKKRCGCSRAKINFSKVSAGSLIEVVYAMFSRDQIVRASSV